ncbi:MAG TPA: DUF6089 family protein [Bacteroidales bacterium]|nr:DUF6089 family protein [Bacteroidales bacterium]
MKKISLLLLALFTTIFTKAQRSEAGLFLGTSFYMGDINPNIPFAMAKPAGGLLYRYNINPRWSVKLNGLYGTVQGDDAVIKYNPERNLSFRSKITDVSAQIELNFFPYVTGRGDKMYFSPYIFTGIALFHFNPQAMYQNKWYDLQPLGTEGQGTSFMPERKKYALTSFAIPFGLGIKYSLGKNFCIGAEWSMRKTFIDYLDDVSTTYVDPVKLAAENTQMAAILADRTNNSEVSKEGLQRGNSQTKDWYSFAGVFITYVLKSPGWNKCSAYPNKNIKYQQYRY